MRAAVYNPADWLPPGSKRGIDLARRYRDVRRLVLDRWRGPALALDPEDVVQDVCRRILRRNTLCGAAIQVGWGEPILPVTRGSAWDPARGSPGHYVYEIASCAIADLLIAHRRVARHELQGGPAGLDLDGDDLEAPAPEPDPDDLDLEDLAPQDPDAREDFFRRACLALTFDGEEPAEEQLWQRALSERQRRQRVLFGPAAMADCGEPVKPFAAPVVAVSRPRPIRPEVRQASLF